MQFWGMRVQLARLRAPIVGSSMKLISEFSLTMRALIRRLFQLPNPFLQELPLWFLLGQRQGFLIRGPSLSCPAESAVQICAGGMRQIIVCQFALFQHRVDMRQAGLWTIAHCNGHGTI